jgi:hypothetical protein
MSVIEYIVAMNLVWKYAEATGNPRWRGLTWGMLPMHASSICAVTHHFFYNNPELIFLVTLQAFLTMLGNTTTMIAAYRIAKSNGWNVRNTVLCCRLSGNHQELARQLTLTEGPTSNSTLLIKLTCFTVLLSYGIKYGELALSFPGKACTSISLEMIVGIPLMTAIYFIHRSYSDVPQHGELTQRNNNDIADESENFYTSREVDDVNDEEEESPLLGQSSLSKNNGTFSLPSS